MTLEGPTMGSEVQMSIELKTWLSIHTKYSRIHLRVDSGKLEQCTTECGRMEFRNIHLPAGRCWLLRAAMLVLCAKPTSTAVEGETLSDLINAQLQVYDVYRAAN
jgi:hypothetical protein